MRRLLIAVVAALAVVAAVAALPAAASPAWCGGTAEVATDRPDTVAALSWHVIYAYPTDAPDRFPQVVGAMTDDLTAIDAWWRAQDPTRALRWDLADFPGCAGGVAALDLSAVKLAHDSNWFRGGGDRWGRLRDDLVAVGFGDADKKVLVYFDGPLDLPLRECGIAHTGSPATGGGESYAIVYLGTGCGNGLGAATFPAVAAVHEMVHSLNALDQPRSGAHPPNACRTDAGHPCDSPTDLMYPSSAAGVALSTKVLDFNHDDYYAHSGPWWDVQDSLFLDHLDSADRAAPGPALALSARSNSPGTVELTWQAATDDGGAVSYEVYRDGAQVAVASTIGYSESLPDGTTRTYDVRTRDGVGHLGPAVTLRYTGGLGIVDATGVLLKDTVAPGPAASVRGKLAGKVFTLSWAEAIDAGGIAGYRVYRDGKLVATARNGVALVLPASRAGGTWTVRAFDRAGNLGALSASITMAPPKPARSA